MSFHQVMCSWWWLDSHSLFSYHNSSFHAAILRESCRMTLRRCYHSCSQKKMQEGAGWTWGMFIMEVTAKVREEEDKFDKEMEVNEPAPSSGHKRSKNGEEKNEEEKKKEAPEPEKKEEEKQPAEEQKTG